jgi:peptide chain release factor 3
VALLGAVGPLQFEVVQYRLESEYGAQSRLEPTPWRVIRWLRHPGGADPFSCNLPTGTAIALDAEGRPVALFPEVWLVKFFAERNEGWELAELPFPG